MSRIEPGERRLATGDLEDAERQKNNLRKRQYNPLRTSERTIVFHVKKTQLGNFPPAAPGNREWRRGDFEGKDLKNILSPPPPPPPPREIPISPLQTKEGREQRGWKRASPTQVNIIPPSAFG